MTPVTRMFLIVLLMLPVAGRLAAQETTTADATATAAEAATDTAEVTDTAAPAAGREPLSSYDVRGRLTSLIHNGAPELGTILALQPNLLGNAEFMAAYPEVAAFVAEHPEIKSRPRFFLGDFAELRRQNGPLSEILEPLASLGGILLVVFAISWLVRTLIEQRRWSRLSKTQAEVHNKILDRFGTSTELLEYIRTPAGTKFLESAPIPLHAEKVTQPAPHSRIILSIQIGVVAVAAALGMLLVSTRYAEESGQGFFALGTIALCVGLGFIASAVVTIVLSRRLGLWQGQPPAADEQPGLVR